MLRMGVPSGAVEQALKKEGKYPGIAGMDPNKSSASQAKQKVKESPSLKEDPKYTKFFKVCLVFTTCLPISSCLCQYKITSAIWCRCSKWRCQKALSVNQSKMTERMSVFWPREVLWKSTQARKESNWPSFQGWYRVSEIFEGMFLITFLLYTLLLSSVMHTTSTPPSPQQMFKMNLPHGAVQNALKMEGKDCRFFAITLQKLLKSGKLTQWE